jgi:hypothetical protein
MQLLHMFHPTRLSAETKQLQHAGWGHKPANLM